LKDASDNQPIILLKKKEIQPMKVKELIEILKKCDQDLPVFVYSDSETHEIDLVDDSISDRIDLNIQTDE